MAQEVFGEAGLAAIFDVMKSVKELFRHVEPERVTGRVIVFRRIPGESPDIQPPPASFSALSDTSVDLIFEVASDGRCYRSSFTGAIEELAATAVVYHYNNSREEFLAGAQRKPVLQLDLSAPSQFSIPTLSTLREALQLYAVESVRESTCHVFEQTWKDANRIFFIPGPEKLMRRSLTQFLRNRLGGDHDVWPEQNVNEKNPVDIQVAPRFSNNRLMIIEIKWLGDSLTDDGRITVRHRNARAQEGADQLADYLDEQRRFAPSRVTHGYYVIIDGRRAKLRPDTVSLSHEDGLHFENVEIPFAPARHVDRDDFDPPYRMFARPVC
jgi:hypothetical protein